MKAKVDVKKFITLVESGMVKKGNKSLIPHIKIRVLKDKLAVVNVKQQNDVASVLIVNDSYFESLESNIDKEELTIDQEILDGLSNGFKGTGDIVTTSETLTVDDGTDKLEAELQQLDEVEFPLPLSNTQYGIIPDVNKFIVSRDDKKTDEEKTKVISEFTEKDTLKGYNVYKTKADALKLPSGPSYEINLKNNVLEVTIPFTTTKFTHKIVGENISGKKGNFMIDGEYYRHVVSNLSGDIYIIYNEGKVIFTEVNDNLSKTYMVATRVVM